MIYVTGASGQLGSCLTERSVTALECDITNRLDLEKAFKKLSTGDCLINAAAYTHVDNAEGESQKAKVINTDALNNMLFLCKEKEIKLIHISTDYVFDGTKNTPYLENDVTHPRGVYGRTKLEGENIIKNEAIIIRTSWLYSEYGTNFVKTMLSLKDKDLLKVVYDQFGTPTYAGDLADVLIKTADAYDQLSKGVYHYSNEGVTSWYDFAKEIFDIIKSDIEILPIESCNYPTKAERPHYSVLNKNKIKESLGIEIPHWKESLKVCMKKLSL